VGSLARPLISSRLFLRIRSRRGALDGDRELGQQILSLLAHIEGRLHSGHGPARVGDWTWAPCEPALVELGRHIRYCSRRRFIPEVDLLLIQRSVSRSSSSWPRLQAADDRSICDAPTGSAGSIR